MLRKIITFFFAVLLFSSNSNYLSAQDATHTVGYIQPSTLTIDGDESDWPTGIEYLDLSYTINKVEDVVSQDPLEYSSTNFPASDLSAYMRIGWNMEFFFLFVSVSDDIDDSQEVAWKSDNIEVFFNVDLGNDLPFEGDNNYTGSDGKRDAIQMRFARDTAYYYDLEAYNQYWGPQWIMEYWDKFNYRVDNESSTVGYTLEAKIPFDSLFTDHTNIGEWVPDGSPLGLEWGNGYQLGFDVMVTDYDGATTIDDYNRDGHITWANSSGNDLSHKNTELFGTITLQGAPADVRELKNANISIYPTLVTNTLTIKSQGLSQIEILSISGQQIEVYKNIHSNMQINLNHLQKGMYLVRLHKDNTIYTQKIIKQ